jgi:hypothetical protein
MAAHLVDDVVAETVRLIGVRGWCGRDASENPTRT